MIHLGREIYKLSGSGNDFVFVDARNEPAGTLEDPAVVAAVCARATGVGADGVVFLEPSDTAAYRIRYLNRDGSRAALCGNAALCSARLAVELGAAASEGFTLETDAGILCARVVGDRPEVALTAPSQLEADMVQIALAEGERRVGYAVVGVPHLVVLCGGTSAVDVAGRGPVLRSHPALERGANVNFVAPDGSEWRIGTYERGVEAETLACGTGAAASALVLAAWGLAAGDIRFRTIGGYVLDVGLASARPDERFESRLRLRGSARIVFRGRLGELPLDGTA